MSDAQQIAANNFFDLRIGCLLYDVIDVLKHGMCLKPLYFVGAPGGIRTPDPRIRSPMLYPAELRARRSNFHIPYTIEHFKVCKKENL